MKSKQGINQCRGADCKNPFWYCRKDVEKSFEEKRLEFMQKKNDEKKVQSTMPQSNKENPFVKMQNKTDQAEGSFNMV